jgi:hypothetical protein
VHVHEERHAVPPFAKEDPAGARQRHRANALD